MGRESRRALTASDLSFVQSPQLDPEMVWTVATQSNRAHRYMATELLDASDERIELRVRWRRDLADGFDDGCWSPLALSAVADHVCSLAALVALGDPARFGATLSLRVEHRRPALAGWDLHGIVAIADCAESQSVLRTTGILVQPTRDPSDIAVIHGTVIVASPAGDAPGGP